MKLKTQLKKLRLADQRGDTLIEVTIAIIIIGLILFSAYVLSSRAFGLGQSAKERSQAAQILQSQAEGLRALKDGASDWQSFCAQLEGAANSFHVREEGGQWQVNSGAVPADQLDPNLAGYYSVEATATFENAAGPATCSPPSGEPADKSNITINITWERFGGGPQETSTLYLHLADTSLPVVSL